MRIPPALPRSSSVPCSPRSWSRWCPASSSPVTQGVHPGFAAQWTRSCATTWPVAFPTVTLVAPWVRRIVGRVTA